MISNEFTWRECRPTIVMRSGFPLFQDIRSLKMPHYLHHCSTYGFRREDAEYQIAIGNVKNRKVFHYAAELIIDVDNVETAEKVFDKLNEYDFDYEMWKLNHYKFYLTRELSDQPTENMCYQDKRFVWDFFNDCNIGSGIDYGLYNTPFHLCRARGAFHEGTLKRSVLEYTNKGSYAVSTNHIEIKGYAQKVQPVNLNLSDWEELQFFISMANGSRANSHFNLFALGSDLKNSVTYETGLELALIYARAINYDEEKAERAFKQGYLNT